MPTQSAMSEVMDRKISDLCDDVQNRLFPHATDVIRHHLKHPSGVAPMQEYLFLFVAHEACRRGGYPILRKQVEAKISALKNRHPGISAKMQPQIQQLAQRMNRPPAWRLALMSIDPTDRLGNAFKRKFLEQGRKKK